MEAFLETCFTGPVLPASILLVLVAMYWAMFVVGAAGLELFDLDLDFDADLDVDSAFDTVMSAGAITLRFLNIGKLPFNLWLSVFALAYWVISIAWDKPEYHEAIGMTIAIAGRNALVSLVPAKILTQPLRGKFDPVEPDSAEDLVGKVGEVTTSEVSQSSGQARFASDGAPLLLNVRTIQGILPKNEQVTIVDYESDKNIYLVEKACKKDVKRGEQ